MKVHLLRCNGEIVAVFSTEEKAVTYMRANRRNGEFWRIQAYSIYMEESELKAYNMGLRIDSCSAQQVAAGCGELSRRNREWHC